MQALGPDINSLIKNLPGKKLSRPSCFKFVYHVVENLRTLHEMHFVHADLKLENILIGKDDPNEIYLIDFGLAIRFRDAITLQHRKKKQLNKFSGNFRFASKFQCRGYSLSRRDDMHAAFHILIFLLTRGWLPWLDDAASKGKTFLE